MNHTTVPANDPPSLESLVESGVVELASLHPGGLSLTGELATSCSIATGATVLDVACGTGASACYLAEDFGAAVVGVDRSEALLARARRKARTLGLHVEFCQGDAQALPFEDAAFDVAICECTLCLLDKLPTLREMARVVRPGGRVGMHDLFWHRSAPDEMKQRLARNEGERPETLEGWQGLFRSAGLVDVLAVDRSALKGRWMRDTRRQLGVSGQLKVGAYAVRRWGFGGLLRILGSERLFASRHLGYALVVGTRA